MRLGVLTAVGFSLIVSLCFADDVRADIKKDTNIPAEDLGSALQTLATQRHFQVVYVSEQVDDIHTQGAKSQLTPVQALNRLLVGTGLTYQVLDQKTVTIIPLHTSAASGSASPRRNRAKEHKTSSSGGFRVAQVDRGVAAGDATVTNGETKRSLSTGAAELQEVVVTAQKREERLIETPLSVSVVSTSDLAKHGATQLRDYASSVPGLNILTDGAGNMIVSMRGLTVGTDVGPTVGIYVDDVPYGSSSSLTFGYTLGFDASPLDLERIEVLKGPQGTLYGASSLGGVIKYVTARPSLNQFSAQVQTGVASIDHGGVSYQGAAAANVPLTDILAARFSAFESHDGGYIDNVALGRTDVNRSDTYGGRVDLLFAPSSNLSVRITGFLQDIGRSGLGDATYTLTRAMPYGSLGQYRPTAEPFHQSFRLGSATVDYRFDEATLTSITSYQEGRTEWNVDVTQLLGAASNSIFKQPFSGISDANLGPTDKFVQEIRLAGVRNRPLEWVIGGFFTHEMTSLDSQYLLYNATGYLTADNLSTVVAPESYKEYAASVR